MNNNIKYVAIGNAISTEIVLQETLDPSKKDNLEREAINVLKKEIGTLTSPSSVNKTLKKDSTSGIIYYRSTQEGEVVYFVIAKPTYSYNRILTLIAEMAKLNSQKMDERKLSNCIYDVMRQYDANPQEKDSLQLARQNIDSLTNNVKENVEKVMKNQAQLGDIETKSRSLSDTSRILVNQSKQLEQQMKNRRRRMYMIIGFILLLFTIAMIVFFSSD
ncbi:hypothetical protein ABPG74_013757 [Tetrahymena malaccensis]